VAINDFLASGRDGYTEFGQARRITPDADAPLWANAVIALVKRLGTVRTAVEGRIAVR
jgi:hypothetical protein